VGVWVGNAAVLSSTDRSLRSFERNGKPVKTRQGQRVKEERTRLAEGRGKAEKGYCLSGTRLFPRGRGRLKDSTGAERQGSRPDVGSHCFFSPGRSGQEHPFRCFKTLSVPNTSGRSDTFHHVRSPLGSLNFLLCRAHCLLTVSNFFIRPTLQWVGDKLTPFLSQPRGRWPVGLRFV